MQVKAATFHSFDQRGMDRSYCIRSLENLLNRRTKLYYHVTFFLLSSSFFLHGRWMLWLELKQLLYDLVVTLKLQTARKDRRLERPRVLVSLMTSWSWSIKPWNIQIQISHVTWKTKNPHLLKSTFHIFVIYSQGVSN